MKIERLSENQIRCTLNKSDLASRQLKISELAYGSEKAKELFRDMMQQASYELGFEADDIPLMIEAIPVSAECIVLIVTKVDNPEELDTRFSRFSPSSEDDYDDFSPFDDMETIEGTGSYENATLPTANEELEPDEPSISQKDGIFGDDLMNLFSKVKEYLNKNVGKSIGDTPFSDPLKAERFVPLGESFTRKNEGIPDNQTELEEETSKKLHSPAIRVFRFDSIDDAGSACEMISHIYTDESSFYKNSADSCYYLVITKDRCSSINFNKVCNILSEYGTKLPLTDNYVGFLNEHYECIIARHAVKVLSDI